MTRLKDMKEQTIHSHHVSYFSVTIEILICACLIVGVVLFGYKTFGPEQPKKETKIRHESPFGETGNLKPLTDGEVTISNYTSTNCVDFDIKPTSGIIIINDWDEIGEVVLGDPKK
jgi:hypothetical protein